MQKDFLLLLFLKEILILVKMGNYECFNMILKSFLIGISSIMHDGIFLFFLSFFFSFRFLVFFFFVCYWFLILLFRLDCSNSKRKARRKMRVRMMAARRMALRTFTKSSCTGAHCTSTRMRFVVNPFHLRWTWKSLELFCSFSGVWLLEGWEGEARGQGEWAA